MSVHVNVEGRVACVAVRRKVDMQERIIRCSLTQGFDTGVCHRGLTQGFDTGI